jgi:hypothetical protein
MPRYQNHSTMLQRVGILPLTGRRRQSRLHRVQLKREGCWGKRRMDSLRRSPAALKEFPLPSVLRPVPTLPLPQALPPPTMLPLLLLASPVHPLRPHSPLAPHLVSRAPPPQ